MLILVICRFIKMYFIPLCIFKKFLNKKFKRLWVSESLSVMSDSLWPHQLYSSWNSPGQNTEVGSVSLLQKRLLMGSNKMSNVNEKFSNVKEFTIILLSYTTLDCIKYCSFSVNTQ